MVSECSIPHHLYADDSQLYVSFGSDDTSTALSGCAQVLTRPVLDVYEQTETEPRQNWILPDKEQMAEKQISLNTSQRAFWCWNEPNKIC